MEDILILVDPLDNPVGTCGKAEAHRRGLLHRAFSVFLIRDGKMLIQQRQFDKYHSGGLWANAVCSHPRAGETLTDAVPRRMNDEIGCTCPVTEIGHFVYRSQYAADLFEYEYDHVFVGEFEGELRPNPEEIAQVRWIGFDELRRELTEQPEKFSTWFFTAASMVLEQLGG